jgi:hypothetical protein
MQTAVTIATAACCSPQNAVNMDYLSNCASGKSSLLAHPAQAFVVSTRVVMNLSCWIGRQQKFKTGPAESGLLRPTPHPPSLLESPDNIYANSQKRP